MKILSSFWFVGEFGKIGLVVVKQNGSEVRAYIGLATGRSERADELMIAHHGATFYLKTLHQILELMEPTKGMR